MGLVVESEGLKRNVAPCDIHILQFDSVLLKLIKLKSPDPREKSTL